MESVGAYEAKTHLARLLHEVATGKSVLITKHGAPVAKLVPAFREGPPAGEVIRSLRALGVLLLRELISEGRH